MEEVNESADKCHEPENHDEFAWDDVNNCELDPTQVREARTAAMEYLMKKQVRKTVSVQKCQDVTGKTPIKVGWIDTDRQDEAKPRYRSQLVATGIKRCNDSDLFSSTPPTKSCWDTSSAQPQLGSQEWGKTGTS